MFIGVDSWLKEGTAAARVVWLGFFLVLPWRPVIFTIVGDDLHRLFRRTFVLATLSLSECTGSGHHSEHRYHHQLSYYLNHFEPFPSCQVLRTGGRKSCADSRGSKKGATSIWAKSLSGTAENRTVSH